MSDLRIKPNTDNGDLDGQENWTDNVSADSDEFRIQLADIFEPTKLRVAVFEQEQYLRIEPDAQMEALLVDSSFAVERPA